LAYKKNINDSRESPAVYIIKRLLKNKNLKIDYFDPYIPEIKIGNKIIKSIINISAKILKGYSAVIIFTDHDNINYKKILKNSNIIFDTRGVYAGVNSQKIIKL
jgi:UDP-N-acetyl-D-glucosamine dehydrogenase